MYSDLQTYTQETNKNHEKNLPCVVKTYNKEKIIQKI